MQSEFRVGRLRPNCNRIFMLLALTVLTSASAQSQAGRVTLRGTLSETVALSVLPNFSHENVQTNVVNSGNRVLITVSNGEADAPAIRLPLLVRSNCNFSISATVESQTEVLAQLSIVEVHATGPLVSPQAVIQLNVPPLLDIRRLDETSAMNFLPQNVSGPFPLANGPRVSLGGTLDSPNNALQITILIRVQPHPDGAGTVHLTFVGAPASAIQ